MTTATVSGLLISSDVDNNTMALNSTMHPTGDGGLAMLYPVWSMLIILGTVFLVGCVGNAVVIYVIAKAGQRTVTNYYIVNLATADILFLIFGTPAEAGNFASHEYLFGKFMCKTASYMQYVTVQTTCFVLVAISVERYQGIVRPLKSLKARSLHTAVIVTATTWLFGLLLYIPYLLYFDIDIESVNQSKLLHLCRIKWPSEKLATTYRMFIFLFPFALPLLVIAICYSVMVRHLNVPSDSLRGPANAVNSLRSMRQKRKITWMMLTVVLVFAVCWFPFQIYSMWVHFDPNFPYTAHTFNFRIAMLLMIYANSCANPFIYAFLGKNFRESFRKAFSCCSKKTSANREGAERVGELAARDLR